MSQSPNSSAAQSLRVAIDANAAAYRRAVQTSAPGDCWDFVVLTAANEKQARGYRQELALRHKAVGPAGAFFPPIQRSLVVADPPGRRAGSGGATFAVMRALADQFGIKPADFERLRILLIHSGGASQRLPAYSPVGKIFAPLPLLRPDGQIATLFDHLYLTLAGLPERLGPGMLVLAGDVFLLFDHRHVTVPPPGVTAISMRVDAEMGRGHGVFVTDERGGIRKTLQKVTPQVMRREGASDEHDRVLIDTGLLFFDATRTKKLSELAGPPRGLHERFKVQIDLYEDVTAALAGGTDRTEFARGALRRELWRTFHGIPFNVMKVEGQFLHLGTTLQFRDAMVGKNPSPAAELFQQNVLAHSQWKLPAGTRVYQSALLSNSPSRRNGDRGGNLGTGSVVEHSLLAAPSRIGSGSIVSQVVALKQPLKLPDNLLLFQAPIRDARGVASFVQVLCGVEDDFKGHHAEGRCTYLNQPIDPFLRRLRLRPDQVWPDVAPDKRTLWTARLFPATVDRDCAPAVLMLADESPDRIKLARWKKSRRYSMAMLLETADPQAMIAHREMVAAYLQAIGMIDAIERQEDQPLTERLGHFAAAEAYAAAEAVLTRWAERSPTSPTQAIGQARAYWCIAQLQQRSDHPDAAGARQRIEHNMAGAFAKIATASESISTLDKSTKPAHRTALMGERLRAGRRIIATAPVRLDLTGGWTDTPPYCFERGGQVVNLAIDLDGRPPVRAMVSTIAERRITLESLDLARQIDLEDFDPSAPVDVRDPFALHKVALGLAGLLPDDGNMRRHLQRLGVGLHLTTECRVPKGSGLGTSSILAATLLGAIHAACRRTVSSDRLIEQTLVLEQRLSTGGGWQDQVGGIVGGAIYTQSSAGVPQQPLVEPLRLSDGQYEALADRLVVYYSGQQRLARDILRRVMGRWLAREPSVLLLMDELKNSTRLMRQALLSGRWTSVAREIDRYWRIKKELYPGSTTPAVDVLFLELRHLYLAAGLSGAGGGGFAYFFCRDARQAQQLKSALRERSSQPGSMGTVFDTRINRQGLRIERKTF
ncbi:MAG: hypothetical protein IT446_11680 [Phycisphaerales bacterium]|nr:hypothetical protein [Phycisphaerales bacterium]